jgi:hypothetical protein
MADQQNDRNSGRPETGSGEGRQDVTGTTNVRPGDTKVWGDAAQGKPGYDESGGSEIIPSQEVGEELLRREQGGPRGAETIITPRGAASGQPPSTGGPHAGGMSAGDVAGKGAGGDIANPDITGRNSTEDLTRPEPNRGGNTQANRV